MHSYDLRCVPDLNAVGCAAPVFQFFFELCLVPEKYDLKVVVFAYTLNSALYRDSRGIIAPMASRAILMLPFQLFQEPCCRYTNRSLGTPCATALIPCIQGTSLDWATVPSSLPCACLFWSLYVYASD